jgi:hypothetical protein
MTGGAYAAKKFLITSTKQIKPSVIAQLLRGKGVAGPIGPVGSEGKQGPPGVPGKDGVNGAAGESVTPKQVPTKVAACAGQGGSEFKAGGSSTLACNGMTGFTETLPSEKSERGQWGAFSGSGPSFTGVSFAIPVGEETKARVIGLEEGENEAHESTIIQKHECGGTSAAPVAAPGYFCVFTSAAVNVSKVLVTDAELISLTENGFAGKSGAVLEIAPSGSPSAAAGPWVVTAE